MIIPDDIAEPIIAFKDQFFDLKGLSAYCSLKVPTLRDYLKTGLPYFKLKEKILIKRSEFDRWLEQYRVSRGQDIDNIVNGVMSDLSGS